MCFLGKEALFFQGGGWSKKEKCDILYHHLQIVQEKNHGTNIIEWRKYSAHGGEREAL